MTLAFFLKGLLIGLSIAAPVGPIGLLVIRRSLGEGRGRGFVTGLGAATADGVYGAVAGFGLTAVSTFLVRQQTWLQVGGGAFLVYLGVNTLARRARPPAAELEARSQGAVAAFLSTFLLTLSNPMTILSFTAVFAGFGLGATGTWVAASALTGGVVAGSAFWWLLLSAGVSIFRHRLSAKQMNGIHMISAVILLLAGIASLAGVCFR